jgi:hypothetical protein
MTRMRDHAPLRHAGTQTFVAGLRYDRLVARWLLGGPMNRAAFDTWVETQLARSSGKGDVVILDNLAVHRSPMAAKLLCERGAGFRFLPPFSPDLNPNRDGLLEAQGALAPHRRPHPRRPLARRRRNMRPLRPRRMLQFFQQSRLRVRLSAQRF